MRCKKLHLLFSASEKGFALISTLVVMSLLMLVSVAMLSLSSVVTKTSSEDIYQVEAKSNARMALFIAMGELQRAAGPDQRVTAESSILEEPGSGSSIPEESGSDDTKIANRHWVGVWKTNALKGEDEATALPIIHRNADSSSAYYDSLVDRRAEKSDYEAKDEVIIWLVSPAGDTPLDPAVALDEATSTLLVGEHSTSDPLDYVRAGKLDVIKNGATTGKYAYWIGDEGVKARYNIATPADGLVKDHPSLAPAQLGINILPEYVNYENGGEVDRVITRGATDNHSSIFSSVQEAQEARRGYFHDLSFSSVGLPTDTQNGGVRKDLSAFLKTGSVSALGPRSGLDLASPIINTDRLRDVTAKFGLLHSWNKLGENSTAATDTIPPKNLVNGTAWGWTSPSSLRSGINLSQQDTAAIHPVMIDAGISYGVTLTKAGVSSGGITPYRLNIHYFPRVVLWNPYNIKINAAEYLTQINMPRTFSVQIRLPEEAPQQYRYFEAFHQRYEGENLPHRPHFSIPSTSFEPGEALLFTADATGHPNGSKHWGDPDSAESKSIKHFTLSCNKPPPLTDSFYVKTTRVINIPDEKVSNAAFQVFAEQDSVYKLYFYKFYLHKGSDDIVSANQDPSGFPPLQFISQTENGSSGSDAPWFVGIPASASSPLREFTDGPATAFYRFKWGHRMQWLEDTVENETIKAGPYNTPYLGYNTVANHNMRAGWHVRSPIEVAFRATASAGRYTHGISIDDPYGWDWTDTSLDPVPVHGKNRVSPFGRAADFGGQTFPMLDVPRKDKPILSLGAFQHAPLSQFPWHPTYAVGNSLADPRVPRDRTINFISSADWANIGTHGQKKWEAIRQAHINPEMNDAAFLHDLSYESNFALWDSYFLSSLNENSSPLSLDNPRYLLKNNAIETEVKNFHQAGKHILINGAFNVNSTSVKAWAALLASFRSADPGLEITMEDGSKIRANDVYSRFLNPYDEKYTNQGVDSTETWKGYRQLSDDEINELAEEIVKEVKQRGPFVSIADFVNRRLVMPSDKNDDESERTRTGLKGALQAAIDRTSINNTQLNTYEIEKKEYTMRPPGRDAQELHGDSYPGLKFPVKNNYTVYGPKPDHHHWADSKLVGAPSFLTQADILQKLGAVISARSDTFVIRTYGESLDEAGNVKARAYCEAIVQRSVTPLIADDEGIDPHADTTTFPEAKYGRKFQIVSFRWLNHKEI